MKKLVAIAMLSLAGLATSVQAQPAAEPAAPAANSQQTKMADCNKQATGKKGDERKAFMSSCLSSTPKKMTQQEKMTACNKQATGKKGDERKSFMSTCLKAG